MTPVLNDRLLRLRVEDVELLGIEDDFHILPSSDRRIGPHARRELMPPARKVDERFRAERLDDLNVQIGALSG